MSRRPTLGSKARTRSELAPHKIQNQPPQSSPAYFSINLSSELIERMNCNSKNLEFRATVLYGFGGPYESGITLLKGTGGEVERRGLNKGKILSLGQRIFNLTTS